MMQGSSNMAFAPTRAIIPLRSKGPKLDLGGSGDVQARKQPQHLLGFTSGETTEFQSSCAWRHRVVERIHFQGDVGAL
nr:hypothetical protein [Paracoccus saliphilus]